MPCLLEEVGLPSRELLLRCGGIDTVHCDWAHLLPPGQRQLLAWARLCYHSPALAVVDEGTSSLHVEAEERVYECLRRRRVAVLSVGHRPSLVPLHDEVITMHPAGARDSSI